MKYFNITEFDSPDEIGSGKKMNEDFLEKLEKNPIKIKHYKLQ